MSHGSRTARDVVGESSTGPLHHLDHSKRAVNTMKLIVGSNLEPPDRVRLKRALADGASGTEFVWAKGACMRLGVNPRCNSQRSLLEVAISSI